MVAGLLAATVVRAERPPRAPARVESPNRQFVAVLDAARDRITVFRKHNPIDLELWAMRGYQNVVFLSDQPDYLVGAFIDGCRINLARHGDPVVLTFYRRGKATGSVRLHDLIRLPEALPREGTRRRWCEAMGFIAPDRFRVLTSEGRQWVFDVVTGRTDGVAEVRIPATPPLLESP